MLAKKSNNLEGVEVAHNPKAATPRVAVAIFLYQVPPKPHLGCQRRLERREKIRPLRRLRRVPNEPCVFIRVAVETSSRRRIVRIDRSAGELLSRPVEQIIDQLTVFEQAKLEIDCSYSRRDPKIILRQVNHITRLRVVEFTRIK